MSLVFLFFHVDEILDTCNRTPSRHIIQLPPGCKVKDTGENTLDIGQCSDDPCSRSSSFNQTCGGKEDCCCGPRKGAEYQERILLSCVDGSSEIAFHRVKECRCTTCVLKTTILKGKLAVLPRLEYLMFTVKSNVSRHVL